MDLAQLEAAAHVLARAMIEPPERTPDSLHNPSTLSREARSFASVSVWSEKEAYELSSLFPSQGLSEAIRDGLFGTAVGRNQSGEPCVRVYANGRGRGRLLDSVLPRFRGEKPPIFIVHTEGLHFAQSPVCTGGASVSPRGGAETGTLGAWLSTNPAGDFVGISNNHVLSEFNRFGKGHDVIHPGLADAATGTSNTIGQLDGVVDLKVDDPRRRNDTLNLADIAWCLPASSVTVDRAIGSAGAHPTGEVDLVAQFSGGAVVRVWLCGRSSTTVQGEVTAIKSALFLRQGGNDYYFEDQLELTMSRVAAGDSGALVLAESDDRIGGLFFAIDSWGGQVGFANPWQDVKNATMLNFSYP